MLNSTIFWFRRDLRLDDNAGLYNALKQNVSVRPIFIFDTDILNALQNPLDQRVHFIHQTLHNLKHQLQQLGSDLEVFYGRPTEIFQQLIDRSKSDKKNQIKSVYCNHDYEPNAIKRDLAIQNILQSQGIEFFSFKDQVIFEKNEILTDQGKPYTVYTPYKKKWLNLLTPFYLKSYPTDLYFHNFIKNKTPSKLIDLNEMGFRPSHFVFPEISLNAELLKKYSERRDYPYLEKATSLLGIHFRFGTISVREYAREAKKFSDVWLSELIWREFFMQILFHFPHAEKQSFKLKYDSISWRDDKADFELWSNGMTGFPIVDAGMRELNKTGHMHNRVRMITASFLTKHLLTHWSKGERYFAKYLLDFDLSANNGNWQWAAGTGCDAAPYFRVFNPEAQTEKFDPEFKYIKKWVPELGTSRYPKPMIDHAFGRNRALTEYKKGLT